jgi:predicted polyphosphate/ATP-dependent NAD kinase
VSRRHRLGLLVNPAAGAGGPLAHKGSDGLTLSISQGELVHAEKRAAVALQALALSCPEVELVTYPGRMGEHAAAAAGLVPHVVGRLSSERTTAQDTRNAVGELTRAGVDLVLFAGGDGTAVDLVAAASGSMVALGVPAGVKMQSGVFGITPRDAGAAGATFLLSKRRMVVEAEVVDLDERAARAGVILPRLHGVLRTPADRARIQSPKARSALADAAAARAAAETVVTRMQPGCLYILGPGTNTRAVSGAMGVRSTLLGVDVVRDGCVIALDVTANELDELVQDQHPWLVLSPVGGQGFLIGRGNQQLSPACLRRVGLDGIIVIATEAKLAALAGRPLLVDSGDADVDQLLSGYARVVTGASTFASYRVGSGPSPLALLNGSSSARGRPTGRPCSSRCAPRSE